VAVAVEVRYPSLVNDIIGWRPVDGTGVELAASRSGGIASWSGRVVVAADPQGRRRRVTIIEQDRLAADAETADADGLIGRVVYADVVEL
jgi:hypothetical protein